MDEQQLLSHCCELVPQTLARRGWDLVQDEAAFIKEVLLETQRRLAKMRPDRLNRRPIEKVIEDATINRYSHLWYAACGEQGSLRQRRAFEEVHNYLYPFALHRANYDQHIAEECTQQALINVWQHLDQVRDPGSFPRWAGMIVNNQINQTFKRKSRQQQEISETDLERTGSERSPVLARSALGADPVEANLMDETRLKIENTIRTCLERSQIRQKVIIGLFLEGKSFKELADELDQKISNLHVLKSRALSGLRQCEEFLEVLEDYV